MMETLLLPGLICNEITWEDQVRRLGHKGVRVAHGYRLCHRIGEMAARVLEDAPEQFNLCGHSMGARVALEVFRLAPDRVNRLALLDTGIHGVKPGEADKRYALLELGKRDGMTALVDVWLPPMLAEATLKDTTLMAKMHAMACSAGIEGFEAQIEALLTRPEVETLLPSISVPTLVGVGTLDIWSPPSQHEYIASLLPDAELVLFEGAGHMAPMEAPEAVTNAIEKWIS